MKYRFYVNTQTDEVGRRIGFFGYELGHELTLAREGQIACEMQDSLRLEQLFHIFNSEEARFYFGYRGPSMSVGDIIVFDFDDETRRRVYCCASFGFKPVADFESPLLPTPEKWYVPVPVDR